MLHTGHLMFQLARYSRYRTERRRDGQYVLVFDYAGFSTLMRASRVPYALKEAILNSTYFFLYECNSSTTGLPVHEIMSTVEVITPGLEVTTMALDFRTPSVPLKWFSPIL
ncbi:hypothetical protein T265_04807 [Opisthorchis viverrini]|uniref:Uncharacterized protein n=1 Tax=Opisthorchis viverrini TaxID=6198 RepID=A0A074ZLV4_OPIVI|nr:hypothetical protein T265_04807 [Opisthorchis viverrini]KER28348.1 hypothetical protein T265_04807 [Opisthorchis viverrini]